MKNKKAFCTAAISIYLTLLSFTSFAQDFNSDTLIALVKLKGSEIENYLSLHGWKFYKAVEADSNGYAKTIFRWSHSKTDTAKPSVVSIITVESASLKDISDRITALEYKSIDRTMYEQMLLKASGEGCSLLMNLKGEDYIDKWYLCPSIGIRLKEQSPDPPKRQFRTYIIRLVANEYITLPLSNAPVAEKHDWVQVGKDVSGRKHFIKLAKSSTDEVKSIWLKIVSPNTSYVTDANKHIKVDGYLLEKLDYDCRLRRIRIVSIAVYNKAGKVLDTTNIRDYEQEWSDVLPDTIGEMTLDKACEIY